MLYSYKAAIQSVLSFFATVFFLIPSAQANPPLIAVANYGPHATLQETIHGLKDGLTQAGFKEGTDISYDISNVNFDPTLISQMLSKFRAEKPTVIVALTTPVAQAAKYMFKDTPIVFAAITDPVQAGLLKDKMRGEKNISGATDQQDLDGFLKFVKKILPHAKTIGLLYSTAESNDRALLGLMQAAAEKQGMQVYALPVDTSIDVPLRTRQFKRKVDFIYVGASGPIQPTLPAIAAVADELKIPVFTVDESGVKSNYALGSFAVSYYQVGLNAAKIVVDVLKGKKLEFIPPIYPNLQDSQEYISQKKAKQLNIRPLAKPFIVSGFLGEGERKTFISSIYLRILSEPSTPKATSRKGLECGTKLC